jgi:hypothetical protein
MFPGCSAILQSSYRSCMQINQGGMNPIVLCDLGPVTHSGKVFIPSLFRRWDCVGWLYLARDRDQWHALENTVINFQVP